MNPDIIESGPLPDELVFAEQAKAPAPETDPKAENDTEEAPASESEDSSETAQEDTDDTPEEGAVEDGDPDDGSDAEEDDGEPVAKKKSRAQMRRERKARVDRQRDQELRQMKAELADLKANPGAQPAAESDAPPREEDFDDYAAFVRADAQFEARKVVQEQLAANEAQREKQSEEKRNASLVDEFNAGVEAVIDNYEDYEEVVFDTMDALPPTVGMALLEAERGPELLYQIASDPKVQQKLSSMSPTKVAIELGKMEAALTLPKARTVTNAPAPLNIPKGKSTPVEKSVEELPHDEFRRLFNAGKIK